MRDVTRTNWKNLFVVYGVDELWTANFFLLELNMHKWDRLFWQQIWKEKSNSLTRWMFWPRYLTTFFKENSLKSRIATIDLAPFLEISIVAVFLWRKTIINGFSVVTRQQIIDIPRKIGENLNFKQNSTRSNRKSFMPGDKSLAYLLLRWVPC